MDLMPKTLPVPVLYPDADRYNGDPSTDVVSLKLFGHVTFLVVEGAGGTGTAAITAHACSDVAGSNPEAIPFNYRIATSPPTFGARTTATAAGVTPAAGANKVTAIELDAAALPDTKPCVFLTLTEGVDSPVDAYVEAILSEPRYASDSFDVSPLVD